MMGPNFSNASGAVIGRAEDLAWFDTMPGGRMARRVHSADVGGAFTIVEADLSGLHRATAALSRRARKSSKYLMADFDSSVPAMSSNLGGTARARTA